MSLLLESCVSAGITSHFLVSSKIIIMKFEILFPTENLLNDVCYLTDDNKFQENCYIQTK